MYSSSSARTVMMWEYSAASVGSISVTMGSAPRQRLVMALLNVMMAAMRIALSAVLEFLRICGSVGMRTLALHTYCPAWDVVRGWKRAVMLETCPRVGVAWLTAGLPVLVRMELSGASHWRSVGNCRPSMTVALQDRISCSPATPIGVMSDTLTLGGGRAVERERERHHADSQCVPDL